MDKYRCVICDYIYDPAEGDPGAASLPAPPSRTSPRTGSAPCAEPTRATSKRSDSAFLSPRGEPSWPHTLCRSGRLHQLRSLRRYRSRGLPHERRQPRRSLRQQYVTEVFKAATKKSILLFPYQINGALEILRDYNGSVLLADEVGLGKTITSSLVVKECILRGLAKKILILAPPSLVTQWYYELKDKFELEFKIIEKETDWNESSFCLASLDRVKIFDKNQENSDIKKLLKFLGT